MEPILLIRNSKSGLVAREQEIEAGIEMLQEKGFTVHTAFIQDVLTRANFRKKLEEFKPTTVIACGGDGTVNLLTQYLIYTPIRLAVIPAGTFNHFAKHIGIGTAINDAFITVITGETINIDVAEVNGKEFVNFSSVGFYTQLIKRRVGYQKLSWKKWTAFIIAIYESFVSYSSLELEIKKNDKQVSIKTPLIFIGNNIFDFGSTDILAGRQDFMSGKLHISIAKDIGRFKMLWLGFRSLFSDIKNKAGFTTIALDTLEIKTKRSKLWVSLDGEIEKMKAPLVYKICPKSLRVIVPKS
ncbi:MAG: diacylglycerol kinase family protein [Patescibacteria group bacterium]